MALLHFVDVLDAHNATAPLLSEAFVVVESCSEGLAEVLEISVVFFLDFGKCDGGGGLLADQAAEAGLALDDAEGNVLLAAEGGQVEHQLNGIDVVGEDNELGGAILNESGDVVETVLNVDRLGALLGIFALSRLLQALLFLLLALRLVFG